MPALGGLATIIILGSGGERVLAGEMSVGAFASFFWYVGMILWPKLSRSNQSEAGTASKRSVNSHQSAIRESRDLTQTSRRAMPPELAIEGFPSTPSTVQTTEQAR